MKKLLYILFLSIFAVQVMAQDVVMLEFFDEKGNKVSDTLEAKYIEILPTLKNIYAFQEQISKSGGKVDRSNIIPLQISYQSWQQFKELLPLAYGEQILKRSAKGIELNELLKSKNLQQLIDLAKTALYLGQEKTNVADILKGIQVQEPFNNVISIIELQYPESIEKIEDPQVRYAVLKLKNYREGQRRYEDRGSLYGTTWRRS